jgi:predicted metal-dependent HD superfamily phosphohydrolase
VNQLNPDRWTALWQAVGASGDPLPWYKRLAAAYSEPHRHYHNQQHIAECLAEFDGARNLADQPEAVELALWFHDAVYDPKAGDNEEQSAALAKRCLSEGALPGVFADTVSRLVMATKHHEIGEDPDAAWMVDVDLSILGQPESGFLQYEAAIRQEYVWVPRIIFAPKRAKILEKFLERERIYTTGWFHEKYEQQARRNLAMSVGKLKRWFS